MDHPSSARRRVFIVLFLAFVAGVMAYAFAHRVGAPRPATVLRLDTTMIMSAAEAGPARVAVGERGRVFRRASAAVGWQAVAAPTEATLTRVRFWDDRLGLAVGHDQVILLTRDGGQTWRQVHADAAAETPLLDVLWVDATRALAIGAYGLFMESADAGQTWTTRSILPEGEDRHLNAIARLADGTLVIAGEAGTLLRSADAGATWQQVASPYEGSFFGAQTVSDASLIVYGMRGKVLRSDDAGQTFAEVVQPVTTSLFAASQAPDGRVFVVGQSGELLVSRDGARSFQRHKIAGSPMLSAVLPSPDGVEAFGEKGRHAAIVR